MDWNTHLMEACMKSPVELLSCLFEDFKRHDPSVKGLDRDIITIERRFEHEGYSFLTVTLSSLCDALDRGLASGCFACPRAFRRVRGGTIPALLQGMFCKVFDTITGRILDMPSVHTVKCLREALRMFKKMKLSDDRNNQLVRAAFMKFIGAEERLFGIQFPKRRLPLLKAVARLVLPNLDCISFEELEVRHGPGGVAEGVKTNQKWEVLREAVDTHQHLAARYHLLPEWECFPLRSEKISFDDIIFDADEANGLLPERTPSESAKLYFVPKDSSSLRTITAEPCLNMFIQQGLNTHLRKNISKCGILSRSLALTDQSKNQTLALEGSRTGEWATLDLSMASDLLSLHLVKEVFWARPKFLTSALECRTTQVEYNGSYITLKKFAGMGNALTFPVQSVTFALLAICAVMEQEGIRPSYRNAKAIARNVTVYGDDIIVPVRYAHSVIDWINSFGLIVNQKKSFTEGNFRESCGVDAYKGYEVSPVYLHHDPVVSSSNPEQIASLVSSSNQLWFKGLYRAALCIQTSVMLYVGITAAPMHSSALGWNSRVESIVGLSVDKNVQRQVFPAYVVTPLERNDNIDGYAALWASLAKLDRMKNLDQVRTKEYLKRTVLRFKTKLRRRRVPI